MLTRRDFLKVSAASGLLFTIGGVGSAKESLSKVLPDDRLALESAKKIPLFKDVDVVVVGGSSRAVAAAAAAARAGSKVFLVAGMPYLGDDVCGAFMYDKRKDEICYSSLVEKVFDRGAYPTPLVAKKVFEDTLIDNGVDFLYSSYVTDVLTDSTGAVSGVVISNRSGRQAIRAKAVIDATHNATVVRMTSASVSAFKPGPVDFEYVAVGSAVKSGDSSIKAEQFPKPFKSSGKEYSVTRYTFTHEMKEDTYAALMEAEHRIASYAWDPDLVDNSDLLWYIPGTRVACDAEYSGGAATPGRVPVASMKVKGVKGLYVLGPCADMDRDQAAYLMRPVQAMTLGEILGETVAADAAARKAFDGSVAVRKKAGKAFNFGKVGEILKPLRSNKNQEYVDCSAGSLPVLGDYDVVILGGGTAGAPAGISAARNGARTLVMEYLHGLGGLSTLGLIGVYWDGFREGFTATIDKAVREMAPVDHPRQLNDKGRHVTDWKKEWYRREILKAGGNIWFGILGSGAIVEDGIVKGVVVSTPQGRGVVLCKVLIDSTGSADIAIAAGAGFDYTGKKTLAVQGAGLGKKELADYYSNNDWAFIDDSDILDVSRAFVQSKNKFQDNYDIVKIPQTRERRRVVGEYVISAYDVLNHRRYPDTISYHKSSFDTHGMIVDPYFILSPPMLRHTIYDADVPLRALLPRGLDGIMTTGLGASAHRDAMPVIRMQPCLQNQGYAVGYLSAMAVKEGVSIRDVDIKKVQRHLVSMGNLPERVLTDKEFKGFSSREMKAAAKSVADDYKGLEILLTDTPACMRLMREQMKSATDPDARVIYASILCILGDGTYSSVLRDRINEYAEWDKGWHYTGMNQFGMCLSRLDALIMSLGRSGDKSCIDAVLKKAALLSPEDYFSHFRAVAMAAEGLGCSEAVPVLHDMLTKPGVRRHSVDNYVEARDMQVPNYIDVTFRNKALKELHLSRALYLCGDMDGVGREVLERYSQCLQGHYARYASEILGI